MDQKTGNEERKKMIVSACDVDALKKCLEENKGDQSKCQAEVDAFKQACSLKKPKPVDSSPEPTPSKRPQMKLRRGLMSDV